MSAFLFMIILCTRAPHISTLLRCQGTKIEKSRTGSTLISDFCAFPSIRALLCGAFVAQLIKRKIKGMKGSAVYNRRYPFIFRLLRGNPSIENNFTSTKKRNLYRGWLCRPLIVFYVTVFPSARARHSVSLGRVERFVTARAFTLSVPSLHSVPLGRGAVAPLKVRSSKSAILDGGYLHLPISPSSLLFMSCTPFASNITR